MTIGPTRYRDGEDRKAARAGGKSAQPLGERRRYRRFTALTIMSRKASCSSITKRTGSALACAASAARCGSPASRARSFSVVSSTRFAGSARPQQRAPRPPCSDDGRRSSRVPRPRSRHRASVAKNFSGLPMPAKARIRRCRAPRSSLRRARGARGISRRRTAARPRRAPRHRPAGPTTMMACARAICMSSGARKGPAGNHPGRCRCRDDRRPARIERSLISDGF